MSELAALAIQVGAVLSTVQLPEGFQPDTVICRSQKGPIVEHHLLLGEEQFKEEELRRVFAGYLHGSGEADLYVLASSDPQFFRGRVFWGREVAVLLTEAPVAAFFRIGANAFFQYGRAGGDIRWVVLRGENVFRRRFGQTEVQWAGTLIGTLAGAPCEEGSAVTLSFVSPGVHEADLDAMARYYARLNRHWRSFGFRIFPSFDAAAALLGVRICSLEAMPSYLRLFRGRNPLLPRGTYLSYTFVRWSPSAPEGELLRYDKLGIGPPAWKKRVTLTDSE